MSDWSTAPTVVTGFAPSSDGVRLAVKAVGTGTPILFIHEFAGDFRSWEPQLSYFGDRYRCMTYNARGYAPSSVVDTLDAYSQESALADALAILDWAEVEAAHVVGLSMGGFCALQMAMNAPERCLSITVGGVGYGAPRGARDQFIAEVERAAHDFRHDVVAAAERYASGPTRLQFLRKDPIGWEQFRNRLSQRDSVGASNTLLGVLARRRSLYDFEDVLRGVTVPTLLMVGDEDDGCIEASVMMKRAMPNSALVMFPRTGHTLNLEEPGQFNLVIDQFLARVQLGQWRVQDRGPDRGLIGMLP